METVYKCVNFLGWCWFWLLCSEALHDVLATASVWVLLFLPQCDDMHIRVIEKLYIYSGCECASSLCVRAGRLRSRTPHHFITRPTAEAQIYCCQLTFMHVKVKHLKGVNASP